MDARIDYVQADKKEETGSKLEIKENILIVHVNGELDHHNSVFIREKADEIICAKSIINILFDFGQTEFMDSSGIGVVMGRYKKIKNFGGSVGVINVNKSVKRILMFSGLNKIVKYYDSVEAAVEDMKGGN